MAPTRGWEPSCEVPRTPDQNAFPEIKYLKLSSSVPLGMESFVFYN